MKKLLLALACTIGLAGCGEPEVVYVDHKTGKPVQAANVKLPPAPVSKRNYLTVCVYGVLYFEDSSFRQGALSPVLVPSTLVSIPPSHKLTNVRTKDRLGNIHTVDLPKTTEYVNLVGVTCS